MKAKFSQANEAVKFSKQRSEKKEYVDLQRDF